MADVKPYQLAVEVVPTPATYNDVVWLGTENITELIRRWRQQEKRLRTSDVQNEITRRYLAEARDKLRYLVSARNDAEWKPVFPILRQDDYLGIGESLICFIGNNRRSDRFVDELWAYGQVEEYPTAALQCVLRFPQPVIKRDDPCRIGWWNKRSYQILYQREFQYLLEHPSYFGVWIHNISSDPWCRVSSEMQCAVFEGVEHNAVAFLS